jgi:hypothetical protein
VTASFCPLGVGARRAEGLSSSRSETLPLGATFLFLAGWDLKSDEFPGFLHFRGFPQLMARPVPSILPQREV